MTRPEPAGGPADATGSSPFAPGVSEAALSAALRTLELTVRHRLDGVLNGDHLGLIPGPGWEPGEASPYQPGDDVRRMDWSVTARTTHPHIRQTVADRELETWLVVDMSASMDFGTAHYTKRDLTIFAAAAVTHLTSSGGNRIGAVIGNGATLRRAPARSGRGSSRALLRSIATMPAAPRGSRGDLAEMVDSLRRPQRRRGLVVVISDFLGEPTWERPLRGLSARHDILAIETLDPRDVELPSVGDVVLVDPESGTAREFTVTPRLRADFADAAREHRYQVERALRRCGAPRLTLRTDRDWLTDIVRFVAARKRNFGRFGSGVANGSV